MTQGARYLGDGRCTFTVWAPLRERVEVHVVAPEDRLLPMERDEEGYWHAAAEDVWPGARYMYRLDGTVERPDPASRLQPEGVHAPSEVVDTGAFRWSDSSWGGRPLEELVFYEIHVGTFTREGTFAAIIDRLPYLVELGITAIELMPVAQFPGERNWGYDGVYMHAPQVSYGGPSGLAQLVDACHVYGLAVFLDVVYNHLGPEGNYLRDFGPYMTPRYQTPWGDAMNYDGAYSDHVRRFFIDNALYWVRDFHIDGLRLDAVHAIYDFSSRPFIAELATEVHRASVQLARPVYLVAENDMNDSRIVRPPECGGAGLDAVWNDDFHHSLHTLLTGENDGYYQDFGSLSQMAKAFREGYVYSGQYSAYRKRSQGNTTVGVPLHRFVVNAQNHDQVGNRLDGERLTSLCSFDQLKLAAATLLLSPSLPLLFMGEEYGEPAPFRYFVSHSDPDLIEAVRAGRREEFSDFRWENACPDPQSETSFLDSKLSLDLHQQGHHAKLFRYYRHLLRLRRRCPSLLPGQRANVQVREFVEEKVLSVKRWLPPEQVVVLLNFNDSRRTVHIPFPLGQWERLLDSAAEEWGGAGETTPAVLEAAGTVDIEISPYCAVVYRIQGAVHDEP